MLTIDMPGNIAGFEVTTDFQRWQRDTFMSGLLPVIGVAGTAGKSTVVRLLDAIFRDAGIRTATWTNLGVEIRGRRQRGELSGWSLALSRLAEGNIDVAIQELHWSTIHAVGLPPASYPMMTVTNLRGMSDATWNENALGMATSAAHKVAEAAHPNGYLAINGDDYSLVDIMQSTAATSIVFGHSKESPGLSRHLQTRRPGAWLHEGHTYLSRGGEHRKVCSVADLQITLGGAATFQIANVLDAAAIASAVGIDDFSIAESISRFRAEPDILPGSFNVWDSDLFRVVVSPITPTWTLRLVMRAINPGSQRRQITVLGNLSNLDERDIAELGRLLGRYHGAIVLHGEHDEQRMDAFRHGITANEYPPLIIHLPTERKAINRALRTAREDDVVLMLPSDDPGASYRAAARLADTDRE